MVQYITSKNEIRQYLDKAVAAFDSEGLQKAIDIVYQDILQKKARFQLLEYASTVLYNTIPHSSQLAFTDGIIELQTIGGNVIAGIILQHRLDTHFDSSIAKTEEYIIKGNEWYVCDIVGERVLGHALLTLPQNSIPVLQSLHLHNNKWMVRSIGVATHYAIKKGLGKKHVDEMFRLLLQLGSSTDFHTKKGIGWAAKTTAKFHPDIIEKYRSEINSDVVKQWFKTKVNIGLSRTGKYAHRYTG